MGSKENPGQFDCYAAALPDEPVFVLLGRDPMFAELVDRWAARRRRDVRCGDRPAEDMAMVEEAHHLARLGAAWRSYNNGKWRK